MKKVLLSTSAIALVGAFTSSASANEWDMDVGGYMEQFIAYSDVEIDGFEDDDVFDDDDDDIADGQFNYDGVDVKSDAEIAFVPTLTLDNGVQFGANVQLEANSSGDQIDESYLFAEGAFGEVRIGSENSVGYLTQLGAPDVTVVGVNSGSTTAFAPISGAAVGGSGAVLQTGDQLFRGTLGTTFLENMVNNDAQRISYFTPRFAGFRAGVSYARDAQQDSNQQVNLDLPTSAFVDTFGEIPGRGGPGNIWDFAASYANSFGDFDVALSGRYGFADTDWGHADEFEDDDDEFGNLFEDTTPDVWGAGANFGYSGFTVGGGYAEQNDTPGGLMDGHAWDAGVAYETGPWGVSATYFSGQNTDDENFTIGADEELQQWIVGLSYIVADGVVLGAFGGRAEFEEEVGDGAFALDPADRPGGEDVETWFVGTSAALAF